MQGTGIDPADRAVELVGQAMGMARQKVIGLLGLKLTELPVRVAVGDSQAATGQRNQPSPFEGCPPTPAIACRSATRSSSQFPKTK